MSLDAVKDWLTDPDLNTTLGALSTQGSAQANTIDNLIRALMSQVATQFGKINYKGADIASATTTNLANATGNFVDITGTTTITGLGTVAAGQLFFLRFTGALTFTHNGTSLILPGASNITTDAGAIAIMLSLGSGNWVCAAYRRGDGSLRVPSGKAIDFADGDITITHAANLLAFAGAASGYTFDAPIVMGHTAGLQLGSGTGLGVVANTSGGVGVIGIGAFSATASTGPVLNFYRSKNASVGSATVVASGDVLGGISFYGAQETGTFATQTRGARIRAEVAATVTSGASGDMPTSLIFSTTADGGSDVTDRVTIDHTGLVTLSAGQIAFPASQNASSGANTLDDYEEGSTTPTPTPGGGAFTTVTATLSYTKNGREVCWGATVTLTDIGTATLSVAVPLPFTNSSQAASFSGYNASLGTALAVSVGGSGSSAVITTAAGAFPGSNGQTLRVGGTYRI